MKKKLGYLLVAICIVLLMLYLFRYKQVVNIEGKVPSTATEVVRIDLRQIEHHLLVDAIKNPLKYISFKSKNKEAIPLRKSITIPKNLLFFTNVSNLKDAWFSSFVHIKDNDKLRNYLLQEGFQKVKDERLEIYGKDKLVIGVANNKLVVAYKNQQDQSITSAIQAIFEEVNFYDKNADLLKSMSDSESDISYASEDSNFFEANFKNGLFEIKGKLISDLFKDRSEVGGSENSIGFIAAKINKKHASFKSLLSNKSKNKFDEFTKLSIDSIVSKWNGSIVLDLKAIDQKSDTISTYEYDDDFNKIEKKSVQVLNIPNLTIALESQAGLYEYLRENNAIKVVENDTLFTSFPLYNMYARKQRDKLYIFTQKPMGERLLKETQNKLNAHMDIARYLETPLEFFAATINNEYTQFVKNISAELTANDELLIQVRLKKNSRNFLGQFIKP